MSYETIRSQLRHLEKPCLFLDQEAFRDNMERLLSLAGGKRIRIASKSLRSVGIIKQILQYDEAFQGVMCYSAKEAIYLHEQGLDDLLVAYPIWDETQLIQISQLVKKGARITLMIDRLDHVKRMNALAERVDGKFLLAIDVDLSSRFPGLYFGVYRSPIYLAEQVISLLKEIRRSPRVLLDGLMGYEAQIAGLVDTYPNNPWKNWLIRILKKHSMKEISKKRKLIAEVLQEEGMLPRFINGGGTGSLLSTREEQTVTEVTAGSGFYQPHLFDRYRGLDLQPALFYAIEITRIPQANIYTCLGGGYVASGTVGKDKVPEIHLPKGARLSKHEGVGEVQTPIFYEGEVPLELGDPIVFRHSKAGEICERFHEILIFSQGEVIGSEKTYRGDGQCFL